MAPDTKFNLRFFTGLKRRSTQPCWRWAAVPVEVTTRSVGFKEADEHKWCTVRIYRGTIWVRTLPDFVGDSWLQRGAELEGPHRKDVAEGEQTDWSPGQRILGVLDYIPKVGKQVFTRSSIWFKKNKNSCIFSLQREQSADITHQPITHQFTRQMNMRLWKLNPVLTMWWWAHSPSSW